MLKLLPPELVTKQHRDFMPGVDSVVELPEAMSIFARNYLLRNGNRARGLTLRHLFEIGSDEPAIGNEKAIELLKRDRAPEKDKEVAVLSAVSNSGELQATAVIERNVVVSKSDRRRGQGVVVLAGTSVEAWGDPEELIDIYDEAVNTAHIMDPTAAVFALEPMRNPNKRFTEGIRGRISSVFDLDYDPRTLSAIGRVLPIKQDTGLMQRSGISTGIRYEYSQLCVAPPLQ